MDGADAVLLAGAGVVAGFVNGVAGGGSLVSFPALLATGQPALVANVTNTVGLLPGYAGGAAGFAGELRSQRDRVRRVAPVALAGGVVGAVLLLLTGEQAFEAVAPVLVLLACLLFAVQPRVARAVAARRPSDDRVPVAALVALFAASVYGGYFGAGVGVVLLAVLGIVLPDPLPRVNALRGLLALLLNVVAAVVFCAAADVAWGPAAVLGATSLVGGWVGARWSLRVPVPLLRAIVIGLGLLAAVRLLVT